MTVKYSYEYYGRAAAVYNFGHSGITFRNLMRPITLGTPLFPSATNEFELHARAILGSPVDTGLCEPGASAVIYGQLEERGIAFKGVDDALRIPGRAVRLFGKPEPFAKRGMGVALANGKDTGEARARAQLAASKVIAVKA